MKRYHLSKKRVRELIEIVGAKYPGIARMLKPGAVEEAVIGDVKVIIANRIPTLIVLPDDTMIPALHVLLKYPEAMEGIPRLVVDRGATPFIARGADVMAPGVRDIPVGFGKGDVVLVLVEGYTKPICVGRALYSSDEIRSMRRGKVVKNLHHIGDKLWNTLRGLG